MTMTTEELEAIRKIVQEETRKIVREEQVGLERHLAAMEGRSVITNTRLDHVENSLHIANEKLDRLVSKMDVVYEWVERIEIDVRNLTKNA
jgi:hypothetical protein